MDDTLVLTVNRRLASYLTAEYTRAQKLLGKQAWRSPAIFFLDDWLKKQLLNHPRERRQLLSLQQERCLWERIVLEQANNTTFLQTRTLAKSSQQAFTFLKKWDVEYAQFKHYYCSESVLFFMRCASQFEKICQEKQWMVESELLPSLLQDVDFFSNALPHKIELAGFDETYPRLDHLVQQFKKHRDVVFLEPKQNAKKGRLAFSDCISEAIAVADWAKARLNEAPDSRVGCVVRNLPDIRSDIFRVFKKAKIPFDLSMGKPLSDYPIVRSALLGLSLNRPSLSVDQLGEYLYSPFFKNSQTDMTKRLGLLSYLKQQGTEQIPIAFLKKQTTELDDFLKLKTFSNQLPSQWGKLFTAQLLALGWASGRTLNSEEYQSVKAFWGLFENLDQLDLILGDIPLSTALSQLDNLAFDMVFQPEARTDAKIRIVGMLEASGMSFDYLWVLGLDADHWPAKPLPSALIPVQLQREQGMPHASATRELRFSQAVMARLLNSAQSIVLSYSKTVEDMPAMPSGLIRDIPLLETLDLASLDVPKDLTINREVIKDSAPSVTAKESIRGGTYILKAQATCPFQAFAHIRLHARNKRTALLGLDALDRGTLLHDILEQFWHVTKTQAQLLALSDEGLNKAVSEATDRIFQKRIRAKPLLFKPEFILVEKKRVQKLITEWLNLEKKREPFVVKAVEKKVTFELRGVEIRVKIDRIDQLQDGSFVLIDYKSGKTQLTSWQGARMDDPQLPFYFAMSKSGVNAVSFGQIHPEGVQFNGVASRGGLLPNVKPVQQLFKDQPELTWSGLKAQWKKTAEQLFDEFYEGKAEVDPKQINKTCEQCDLQTLCRVHEY